MVKEFLFKVYENKRMSGLNKKEIRELPLFSNLSEEEFESIVTLKEQDIIQNKIKATRDNPDRKTKIYIETTKEMTELFNAYCSKLDFWNNKTFMRKHFERLILEGLKKELSKLPMIREEDYYPYFKD